MKYLLQGLQHICHHHITVINTSRSNIVIIIIFIRTDAITDVPMLVGAVIIIVIALSLLLSGASLVLFLVIF